MNIPGDERSAERDRADRFDVVSRIADDVAHELKNPINSIVINLEVLRSRIRAGQPEAALGRADVIDAEVRRVYALLDALLRLLRPDRDPGETLLADIVEDAAVIAQAKARISRAELVVGEVDGALPARVARDALRVALLHVFASAIDGAAEDGQVQVSAAADGGAPGVRVTAGGGDPARMAAAVRRASALLEAAGVVIEEDEQGSENAACTLRIAPPLA